MSYCFKIIVLAEIFIKMRYILLKICKNHQTLEVPPLDSFSFGCWRLCLQPPEAKGKAGGKRHGQRQRLCPRTPASVGMKSKCVGAPVSSVVPSCSPITPLAGPPILGKRLNVYPVKHLSHGVQSSLSPLKFLSTPGPSELPGTWI